MANPRVFFDIAANGKPMGRIVMEVNLYLKVRACQPGHCWLTGPAAEPAAPNPAFSHRFLHSTAFLSRVTSFARQPQAPNGTTETSHFYKELCNVHAVD